MPRAGRIYADGRSTDNGPSARDNVSVLSPYLRYRIITEVEVIAAVLGRHSAEASEKFVQEVLWRTYWKGWLELRPTVWSRFIVERDDARATVGLATAVDAAQAGQTGIEGFDDWARELVDTGYLHNHARMWFASIWIFTLGLPWTLGANFFLQHLVDADAASNTLSWRWVAGLQTAGKVYLATAENIKRHTNGRFNPKGLATTAEARTETPLPPVQPFALLPAFDVRTRALLLLTPEDMNPESLLPRNASIRSVVTTDSVANWPWGSTATAFVAAALNDARTRVSKHFDCGACHHAALDADRLIAAARDAGVAVIVTPHAPVGPIADALATIAPKLLAAGISLMRVRRSWDDRFWPFATKGFFPFKAQIPRLLGEEGVNAQSTRAR